MLIHGEWMPERCGKWDCLRPEERKRQQSGEGEETGEEEQKTKKTTQTKHDITDWWPLKEPSFLTMIWHNEPLLCVCNSASFGFFFHTSMLAVTKSPCRFSIWVSSQLLSLEHLLLLPLLEWPCWESCSFPKPGHTVLLLCQPASGAGTCAMETTSLCACQRSLRF